VPQTEQVYILIKWAYEITSYCIDVGKLPKYWLAHFGKLNQVSSHIWVDFFSFLPTLLKTFIHTFIPIIWRTLRDFIYVVFSFYNRTSDWANDTRYFSQKRIICCMTTKTSPLFNAIRVSIFRIGMIDWSQVQVT